MRRTTSWICERISIASFARAVPRPSTVIANGRSITSAAITPGAAAAGDGDRDASNRNASPGSQPEASDASDASDRIDGGIGSTAAV